MNEHFINKTNEYTGKGHENEYLCIVFQTL